MFPILAFWLNMQSILSVLQQDPAVVRLALPHPGMMHPSEFNCPPTLYVRLTAKYMRIFCAALPVMGLTLCTFVIGFINSVVILFLSFHPQGCFSCDPISQVPASTG